LFFTVLARYRHVGKKATFGMSQTSYHNTILFEFVHDSKLKVFEINLR